ncbi:MAG TPA: HypC/HybG/HupF family hydrogenase formation chaperone, partial [Firmicutes bacterium]|nr:HypC/HybG/HupF family hydrogenase formation chaperone [Bacillota bacterium]
MCLAIPMKVIKVKGSQGIVELSGVEREVNLQLVEDVSVGDYILIHAGFAIQ